MNDNHKQLWINEEKEQLTDNDIVDPVSPTSNMMEPYIFCGLKCDLKILSTAQDYKESDINKEINMGYWWNKSDTRN